MLSGPSEATGPFELSWTFDWPGTSAARGGFGKIAGMDIIEDAYFVDVDILEVLSTDGGTVAGHIMDENLNDLSVFFVP